jgi:hypothetical protein
MAAKRARCASVGETAASKKLKQAEIEVSSAKGAWWIASHASIPRRCHTAEAYNITGYVKFSGLF